MTAVRETDRRGLRTLLPAYTLPALCWLFVWVFIGVRYEVNDDATLANIASGAYGPDTQYLVYINILIGWLIKPLYWLAPGLNWLYILQTAAAICAFGVLCRLLLERFGMRRGLLLCVFLLALAGVDLFQSFQYVKNSGLYLITGFVLMGHGMGSWKHTGAGILWVLLGSLVRFQNLFAVAGIAAGFLLLRFLKLDAAGKRRAVLACLLATVLTLGAKGIDWLAYQSDPDWQAFVRYNAVRTEISDFRLQYLEDSAALEPLGYSANDYDALNSWNYWDDEVFPVSRLEELAASLPRAGFADGLRQTAQNLLAAVGTAPLHLLFSLFCLAALFFADKKRSVFALVCLAMTGVMIAYLSFAGRYPHRVEYVLLLAGVVFSFLCCEWKPEASGVSLRASAFFSAFVLVLLCLPGWMQLRRDMQQYRADRAGYEYYSEYAADKQHLYIADVTALDSLSGYDVLRPREKDFFSNIVFMGGWLSNSPFQKDALARYDVENPCRDFVGREDVYLIDYYNVSMKEIYLAEHYGLQAARQTVRETPNFWLYTMDAAGDAL